MCVESGYVPGTFVPCVCCIKVRTVATLTPNAAYVAIVVPCGMDVRCARAQCVVPGCCEEDCCGPGIRVLTAHTLRPKSFAS